MKVYLVKANGTAWDLVYGVATTVDKALEIAHRVQEVALSDEEHLEIAEVETDKFLAEGA